MTVTTIMKLTSLRKSTQKIIATSRPGQTGQSSKALTITVRTTKTMQLTVSTRAILTTTEARAGTIPTTTEARAGTIPTTTEARAGTIPIITEVIGMATTRPAITNWSMSTSMASSSTSTILKRVHTRGTKRMTRTIRRLRRRNLITSPSARAATRSSLLPTREFLSGKTSPQRKILSSSHSG
jgi:hypothetical protein